MKIALSIFLFCSIALMASCQSVFDVKFTTSTRGYNKEIVITPKSVSLKEQNAREPEKKKDTTWTISKDDWKKITQSLDGVMLREIPLLKAPSDKRTYDGARASMITITDKKAKIWYHSFDDESPNETLVPLMNVIMELTAGK